MSAERMLITGARGSLGTALCEVAKSHQVDLLAPTSTEFDITNLDACRRYLEHTPTDIIIHTAALTNWEKGHANPYNAFRVNTVGTLNMALLAKESGARLVHISTDAVFPGHSRTQPYTENDTPGNPSSIYGWSKLFGETMVETVTPEALIARIGWLFGPNPKKDVKFVGAILRQIANGKTELKAVTDKVGSPTYTAHLAGKLLKLADQNVSGVRHIVNSGQASRFDVAVQVINTWNAQATVSPVDSAAFPSNIRRPDFSAMKTNYSDAQLPSWQEALAEYQKSYPDILQFAQT